MEGKNQIGGGQLFTAEHAENAEDYAFSVLCRVSVHSKKSVATAS